MDAIFDLDLINTVKVLKLNRLSIVRFKYDHIIQTKSKNKQIPSATVEKVFDCHECQNYQPDQEIKYNKLSQSSLLIYAWKIAPKIAILETPEQIIKHRQGEDWTELFQLNLINSLLFIPLYLERQKTTYQPNILGSLILQSYGAKQWTDADIEVFKWIGKKVSADIINQQTVAKTQSLVNERTSQLKFSLDVQAKLSSKLRFHLEELRESNRVKDEFIASMSDALKTPLSNLKTGLKMLKLRNKNKSLELYINILEQECDKEINLVDNLLTIQQLRVKEIEISPQKIHLSSFLQDIRQNFINQLAHHQLSLNISSQLDFLLTDLKSLDLIIKELVLNAIKFSTAQTVIYLIFERNGNGFIIEISNIGAKIAPEEQENIFQPFYQGSNVENVTNGGTGLGLALVKSLIENLNGTIEVSSILSPNSKDYINTFTITLPQEVHEVY
ncbi:HAMP domain-containing histidine kinase [Cyanobacterium stanieri LEGE 03274]|uniref:histidine kinase n=1 Tax=Cyanobacterium stanieri LEGE 03274 TaxID=1828756 RepID=A0ABR9V2J1_9CHRO|nr:HAMP domain-containing sensor histidine kinase [Cyanobacterium stanieri]MBE9222119.1 HAMP domain-containing histidine kinase [Cyanobacterium stanieri LEGE 03274]